MWINDHIPIISEMPHGGVGASGFGKDMSDYSFEEYLTIKHVMSDITGAAERAGTEPSSSCARRLPPPSVTPVRRSAAVCHPRVTLGGGPRD